MWDSACVSAPSGVVTFLFTDIEGSTRRWESDADAMRSALAAHDAVLRTAIESHGGFLFKHTGDGVIAAFASPRAAVDAATAAQRDLELPVRMGIATGEAALQDGDYFGAVLNRAARVMGAGHGGQILIADSTASLVNGLDVLDLGLRRLRDVPAPVGLFQVRAEGLRGEFPPLRALDTSPGNLRPASTSIIGRDDEIAAVTEALRAHRLVTLTGVGGVGKTRLALEIALQLSDEFPDGVWLFELAAVSDPAAVPDAIASVLGATQQPGMTLTESVATALEGRVRLLVLDNCEHVLDAAADLIEIVLRHSATVRILATSREGLGLADEQVWRVRSLDVSTAADLFVERARSVTQSSTDDEAATIEDICRRLDGIPLAVELAASRMASMSAGEVRDRLDQRFRLLVGSRRGLERHQTLRHAVQWSYDLLDDPEKRLLERCSVFAGGFDLASACAVANSDDDFATLDLLDALVRKSLLTADPSSGHTRYSLLETIRQFAEDQLIESGAADQVRAAHASFFAGCEHEIMNLWDSPRQGEAYTWFTTELANLRNAFRWAADHDDLDTAAGIATFVGLVGFLAENYETSVWAEELVKSALAVGHPRLAYLCQVASVCYMAGRLDDAIAYVETLRTVQRDRRVDLPFGLEGLAGGVYLMVGQPMRTIEWCHDFLKRGGDTHGVTRTALANAYVFAGSPEEAMSAATGIVETAEATGNPWVLSYALFSYALACGDSDPVRALEAVRRGLRTTRDSGNRFNESHMANVASALEVKHGDPLSALRYLTQAIRAYHDAGSVAFLNSPLANLALILDRLGHFGSAAVIAGYAALSPLAVAALPELTATIAHLRDNLGAQGFESRAHQGETMTPSAIVRFAYDQIDQARTALEHLP